MLTNLLLLIMIALLCAILYQLTNVEKAILGYEEDWEEESVEDARPTTEMTDQELADLLGSEALRLKNSAHDEKIQSLIDELNGVKNDRPGSVYDVPHSEVDSTYVRIPKVEYAE